MTFLLIILLLVGVGLIDSGVKHQPIKQYLQGWIGGSKNG